MAARRPLDYATPGLGRPPLPGGERAWQVAEVLSAALLVLLIVGGFLAPFVAVFVYVRWR